MEGAGRHVGGVVAANGRRQLKATDNDQRNDSQTQFQRYREPLASCRQHRSGPDGQVSAAESVQSLASYPRINDDVDHGQQIVEGLYVFADSGRR